MNKYINVRFVAKERRIVMAKKEKKGIIQKVVSTLVLTAVSAGIAVVTTLVLRKFSDKGLPAADVNETPADKDKKEEADEEQYITLNNDDEPEESTEKTVATEPGTVE